MNRPHFLRLALFFASMLTLSTVRAADPPAPVPSQADADLAAYFRAECDRLEADCLADIKSPADFSAKRETMRRQLLEMLGLDPLPEKTDLQATVTGRVDAPTFTVENVHFQSRPHLYVTGNLYVPKNLDKPAPAVLYVCGHGKVRKGDVSYGNKVYYQHHPAWLASHGYVCLIIDSLELGEIEGIHHGTFQENLWWWNSRGYTPAGVEAWNCIRALDYLQSRKEVDPNRLGVTGRSGGGAYSWWVTALDDRIKCAVPVAGITDVRNHVVDGCVEGHCDCMFFVNTWRWDYPAVAALAAPRPLLIANSDKDSIFPLDGVQRLHWKVRRIYGLGKEDRPYTPLKTDLGLQISEGPHADTPELQVAAFRWLNRHLKGEDPPIEPVRKNLFEAEQLRVFKDGLPPDAINAKIHETFVPLASPAEVPASSEAWAKQRDAWMEALREKVFRGWPADGGGPLDVRASAGAHEFSSQPHVRLQLEVVREGTARVVISVGDYPDLSGAPDTYVKMSPRGTGPDAWTGNEKKQAQIRRRFMLLGQTLDGMRVWDVRRAVQAVKTIPKLKDVPIVLEGRGQMAAVALYASLFEPSVSELRLYDLPHSHAPQGPDFLNVLRFLDVPQAMTMAAEGRKVRLYDNGGREGWQFPLDAAKALRWPKDQLTIYVPPNDSPPASR